MNSRTLKTIEPKRILRSHQSPTYSFIDADNVWMTYCSELDRYEVFEEERHKFLFHKLFEIWPSDRCYAYSATNQTTDIPEWLTQLAGSDGFAVKFGELVEKPRGRKQEGVDVKLAIEATKLAYSQVIKSCTLYGADGDFLPLLEAVSDAGVLINVISFSDPEQGRVAPRLRAAADTYTKMNSAWLYETVKSEFKTVIQFPQLYHDFREADNVEFHQVLGNEYEVRKLHGSYYVSLNENSPMKLYGSPKLDDLLLWLRLMVNT